MYYYPQQNPFNGSSNNYFNSQPQISGGIKGRPVSSLEEVRAAQIDFDGSLFVFPDIANKRIYTKQINLDGTASLNMYELTQIPTQMNNNNFVTRDEFQNALEQIKKGLTNLAPQTTENPKPVAKQEKGNYSF